jgi:hypothetical protein
VLTTFTPEPYAPTMNAPSDKVSTVHPEAGLRPAAGRVQTLLFASAQMNTTSTAPVLAEQAPQADPYACQPNLTPCHQSQQQVSISTARVRFRPARTAKIVN